MWQKRSVAPEECGAREVQDGDVNAASRNVAFNTGVMADEKNISTCINSGNFHSFIAVKCRFYRVLGKNRSNWLFMAFDFIQRFNCARLRK